MNYMEENKLDVCARLKLFRVTYIDKSQRKASRWLNLPENTLHRCEAGDRKVSLQIIGPMVTQYKMNVAWLITGKGSPILEKPAKNNLLTDISAINGEITVLKQYVKIMEIRHNRLSNLVEKLEKQLPPFDGRNDAA